MMNSIAEITSVQNPKIKKLLALQQKSSERREAGLFVTPYDSKKDIKDRDNSRGLADYALAAFLGVLQKRFPVSVGIFQRRLVYAAFCQQFLV